jgi:pyruvate dehydrogenase E1 component beta subunit
MSGPKITMAEALNQALDGELARDESVFLLGEDIIDPSGGVAKVTAGLSTRYGRDRVRETPISEQAIIGAAVGAAVAGMRPVAEIMIADFYAVWLDQLVNHAAKLRYMSGGRTTVPMTVRGMSTGGMMFGAQHAGRRQGVAHRRHPRRRPDRGPRVGGVVREQGSGAGGGVRGSAG